MPVFLATITGPKNLTPGTIVAKPVQLGVPDLGLGWDLGQGYIADKYLDTNLLNILSIELSYLLDIADLAHD